MAFRYGILGAGRQGTTAAYDLARFGDAASIVLADANLDIARAAAERANLLTGSDCAQAVELDVRNERRVREFMIDCDVCLSAVPYFFNLSIANQAIPARCSLCDLGGNTQVVTDELALDEAAKRADICIVPDCGVGPGMIANLAVYAMEQLDRADEVLIYDGGLPQTPRPPFNYVLYFSIEGLTNEYYGDALYLENGKKTRVKALDERELEQLDLPPFGRLEAIATSGGLSTMVDTYAGKLRTLKNKTLRYPGHYALLKALADVGLLDLQPVRVGSQEVVPRQVLHALLGPRIAPRPEDRDIMLIHIVAKGEKGGRPATVLLDLVDRFDEQTGFSAMARTTGFHLAIVAGMVARGEIPPGAVPLERAVNASRMVEELARRGMQTQVRITNAD